jgi:hypothetical protein
MNDCLVTVVDVDQGVRGEWRGIHNYARGIATHEDFDGEIEGLSNQEVLRRVKMWSCLEKDVPIVVEQMSQEWVGYEIKVFKLNQVSVRVPGELRKKQLTKDGVLPE